MTRKWIEVNDLSGGQSSVIRFKTPTLRSGLSDYSDAYIVVKVRITPEGNTLNIWANKKLVFENNAFFRPCKIKNIYRQCRRPWYCYANV